MEKTQLGQRIVDRDVSGSPLFCDGASGLAHVVAHRHLDAGQPKEGHRVLGAWLATHEGTGSDWIHLQWHMAVFEIATGRWTAAFQRFVRHIQPAVSVGEAYTDAPSLLWRLSLSNPGRLEIPWEPVREAAIEGLRAPSSPYVELHHLLALAGAGDGSSINRWRSTRTRDGSSLSGHVLTRMAEGLGALVAQDYARAAVTLAATAPQISRLGGSRAQNELFELVSQEARWRAEGTSVFADQRAA
ncbi:MAG: hypothetical protein JSU89_05270 [Myxococcales bacterium]|nr:MAG: hypothetical protein JSU89_05270 [Myxococcales bacterium]